MGGRQTKREQQTATGRRQSRAESRAGQGAGKAGSRQKRAGEAEKLGRAGQAGRQAIQMQSQNPKAKRQKPNANAMKKAMANGNGNGIPKLGVSGRKGHAITGMWLRPQQQQQQQRQQQTCVPKGHNVLPDECGPRRPHPRPHPRPRRDGLLPCWLSQTLKCRTDV